MAAERFYRIEGCSTREDPFPSRDSSVIITIIIRISIRIGVRIGMRMIRTITVNIII